MAKPTVSKTVTVGSNPTTPAKHLKKGSKALAPYGEVIILSFGKHGVLVKYTSGIFERKEARLQKTDLTAVVANVGIAADF